jgi:hypothetical protein
MIAQELAMECHGKETNCSHISTTVVKTIEQCTYVKICSVDPKKVEYYCFCNTM